MTSELTDAFLRPATPISPGATDTMQRGFQPSNERSRNTNTPYNTPGLGGAASRWRSVGTDDGLRSQQNTSRQQSTSAVPISPVSPGSGNVIKSRAATEVPLSTVKPGPVWPSEEQLQVAHSYGVQTEEGRYVPLIRADEVSIFDFRNREVAAVASAENMIVLPPLHLSRSRVNGSGPEQTVPASVCVKYLLVI